MVQKKYPPIVFQARLNERLQTLYVKFAEALSKAIITWESPITIAHSQLLLHALRISAGEDAPLCPLCGKHFLSPNTDPETSERFPWANPGCP